MENTDVRNGSTTKTFNHGDPLPMIVVRNCKTPDCENEIHSQAIMGTVIRSGKTRLWPIADIHCHECKQQKKTSQGGLATVRAIVESDDTVEPV